jgi:TatD DNase family protein
MLIDTHCHLTDEKFTDVKSVIEDAKEAGVEKIFIPGTSIEDSKRAVAIAEQENLYAMIGVHPEEVENLYRFSTSVGMTRSEIAASSTPRNDGVVDRLVYELEEIVGRSGRVIGIGEIGLDFYWDKEKKTKDKQMEIFRAQMELAVRLKMPVVIHMREAEEEMVAVLTKMERLPKGEFHCFAGSETFLKYILEKGFYVGFDGNITYKSAENLRDLVHKVPLDRLLLETDSPYLTPEPVRGTVNTPANVKIVATALASELSIATEDLIEQTGNNALCLYSLED